MKHPVLTTALLLTAAVCATASADQRAGDASAALQPAPLCSTALFARCTIVDAHRLAEVRGGYDTGDGLQVSFGITRSTLVNGALVAQSQLSVRDLTLTTGGPTAVGANWTTAGPAAIQLGASNSVRMDQLPMGAVVIQNSLDNQNIRNLTVIDATTNSLQMLRSSTAMGALRDLLTMPSAAR